MQRVISIIGALMLVAATATAVAAAGDITGTVTRVDPRSNIVYFTDGRIVYLEPGVTFMVNGRAVTIDQIRPGMLVAVSGASDTQRRPIASAPAPISHPPIDAAGTVARFDPQTDTLTLRDGRMLKLGPQSSVWQQEQRSAIRPGEEVFVRNAQPTGYRTAWDAAGIARQRMGTVVNVDPASALVILSDGTVVRVSQATKLRLEGQPLTLSQLRSGDEIVIIGTSEPVATTSDSGGMAMPGPRAATRPFATATFDASEIHLVRRHQAP